MLQDRWPSAQTPLLSASSVQARRVRPAPRRAAYAAVPAAATAAATAPRSLTTREPGSRAASQTATTTDSRHAHHRRRDHAPRHGESRGCPPRQPGQGAHGYVIAQSTPSAPAGNRAILLTPTVAEGYHRAS